MVMGRMVLESILPTIGTMLFNFDGHGGRKCKQTLSPGVPHQQDREKDIWVKTIGLLWSVI